MKNAFEKILRTLAIFTTVKEQIESILCDTLNFGSLKTITIFYEYNEKGITIKKENISLYKVVEERNLMLLKILDTNGKWSTYNIDNIKSIAEGKKNILWQCESIPSVEIKEFKPEGKLLNMTLDTCYYAIVNGEIKEEYNVLGVKDGEYIFLPCVPVNKINDLSCIETAAAAVGEVEDNKNINTLISDINKSIKESDYMVKLEDGHIKVLHDNSYSSNFSLLEYNLSTNLTKDQKRVIEKGIDFYLYTFNYDIINDLKIEIEQNYNISVTKDNYKTLSIKADDNLIKIVYDFEVEEKQHFTIIIKNAINKIHKEKTKDCLFSILDDILVSKLQMNLQALAAPVDPQIEKWNVKLDTDKKIQEQLDVLKRIIIKRKSYNNGLNLVPCNGFIISKLLQSQGHKVQFDRNNYTKCYYSIKESTPEAVVISLKDNNNKLHYYTIYTSLESNTDNINMNLQLLASKQLRPIYNDDIQGHKEYQLQQLQIYNSDILNFDKKRINNKMIENYTKYFIYKDNTFMSVPPATNGSYPGGYYEHVRSYNYKVDNVNKIILFTDKEI